MFDKEQNKENLSENIKKTINEYTEKRDKAKVDTFNQLIKVQKPLCKDSEGLYDLYMIGLYNGLQIGLGIMTDKEPTLYKDEEENEDGISE